MFNYKDLSRDQFERLAARLLQLENPNIHPVEGSGGDGGVDCFLGQFNREIRVWQIKHFPDRIQRPQIKESLERVIETHTITTWTLVVSKNFTPKEHLWFTGLTGEHPDVRFQLLNKDKIDNLLTRHPEIIPDFFPQIMLQQMQEEQRRGFDNVFNLLREHGRVSSSDDSRSAYASQLGIYKVRIIGLPLRTLMTSLTSQYLFSPEKTYGIAQPQRSADKFVTRFLVKEGTASMQIESFHPDEDPFKLCYPKAQSVDLWLAEHRLSARSSFIEITLFSSNFNLTEFVTRIMTDCIPSPAKLFPVDFNQEILSLLWHFSHSVDTIKFDPLIVQEIREATGDTTRLTIRRQTLYGDPGLPRIDAVQRVIRRLRRPRRGALADIYYFKARRTIGIAPDGPLTVEVHNNGRIRAWYREEAYSREDMKQILARFIDQIIESKMRGRAPRT